MNWPNVVNICGHEYAVDYVDGPIENPGENGSFYGQIHYREYAITVQDDRPQFDVLITLLHEICHGLDFHGKCDLFEGDDGEEKIQRFTTLLADTLVRSGIIEVE